MIFLIASFLLLFLFFLGEFIFLRLIRQKFIWCVAVGGIRGKSSVTRLIAAALREAGIRVMARTTGSRPVVIFPDGHEEEIWRLGLPNILEGKRFLRLAQKAKSEAIIIELMAIKPECLEVEVRKIFKPSLLLLTNFRPDHVEELGRSREEVARNLLRAVSKDSAVLLLEEEVTPGIKEILEKKGAPLISVSKKRGFGQSEEIKKADWEDLTPKDWRTHYGDDFPDNIRLALAATQYLGISENIAISGMKKVKPDFGSLKIWEYDNNGNSCCYLVSAFAANEPESSALAIKKIKDLIPWEGKKIYGLLLFRRDRGDRTSQWLEAMKDGFFREFDCLFLSGCPYFPLLLTIKKSRSPCLPLFFSLKTSDSRFLRFKDFFDHEKDNFAKGRSNFERAEISFEREKNWVENGEDISKRELSEKETYGNKKRWSNTGRIVIPDIIRLSPEEALKLVQGLTRKEEKPWILIGLGNIVGLGTQLVELWEKTGRRIHG